jgi:hypothetical protein
VAVAAEPEAGPAREQGWRLVLLALALFLLVPAIPPLRVLLPIEQTILLVGPAMTVLSLLAWRNGGRAWLALTWLLLSAWMLTSPSTSDGAYQTMARGWAVLLAGVFGAMSLFAGPRPFLGRALSAVAASVVVAITVVLMSSVSPARVQRSLADELDRRVAAWDATLSRSTETREWQQFTADYPDAARFLEEGRRQFMEIPDQTLPIFPALLGLESLAALALAWSLFHRISRTRVGPPLRPLREFRFGDQMVWGLLAGVAIVAVPTLSGFRGLGFNLLIFFGALYAVRGLAVVSYFLAARRLAVAVLVILAVIAWPLSGILSLGVGLGDTWIDWRGRARPVS